MDRGRNERDECDYANEKEISKIIMCSTMFEGSFDYGSSSLLSFAVIVEFNFVLSVWKISRVFKFLSRRINSFNKEIRLTSSSCTSKKDRSKNVSDFEVGLNKFNKR